MRGENTALVSRLTRIAWLCTVGACLITAVILLLSGYYGYAAVAVAVAASAAVNLA
jgi:hypothetical protein